MRIRVGSERFEYSHQLFENYLQEESGGIPFTSFHKHPSFFEGEIKYKWQIITYATEALSLEHWRTWRSERGNILKAVREACTQRVSQNLLYHKSGPKYGPMKPLYRIRGHQQVLKLENKLYDFFKGGPSDREHFGPRFDSFAAFLREDRLGCQWSFVAYLAFILNPQEYFPILSNLFQRLLDFYGNEVQFSGEVTWTNYSLLLDLADLLREKLAQYGQASAIEIQSYMFLVARLIEETEPQDEFRPSVPSFDIILARRRNQAQERERIGLLGEKYILEQEQKRLKRLGCISLSDQVKFISVSDESAGYDILSFDTDGNEIHIEVKTTTRSRQNDGGFWLSENERRKAEPDRYWRLYRVWNIDTSPTFADLGNIVREGNDEWELVPSSWFFQPKYG